MGKHFPSPPEVHAYLKHFNIHLPFFQDRVDTRTSKLAFLLKSQPKCITDFSIGET